MWSIITEADVLTVLSGAELSAYRAAALAQGQADPVQPTIDLVTDQVRGFVASRYPLGAAGTVPDKLLAAALDLISVRIPNRVGRDPKAGRKDAADAALTLLRDVAAGRFVIDTPAETSNEQTMPRPSLTYSDRAYTRQSMSGSF